MLRVLLIIVLSLYLLSILFPWMNLSGVISVLCLLVVLSTLITTPRFIRILGGTFLIGGASLLWFSGAEWTDYIFSFGPMLDLLMMFTIIPLMGIPLNLGKYSHDIQGILESKVKTNKQLYILTSGVAYFFSIFLNLATLPMAYYAISPSLRGFSVTDPDRFMSRAITRGYAMPLIWAPVTPIVGIVIGLTQVSWASILPYVIPLSLFGLLLDWYMGLRTFNKRMQTVSTNQTAFEQTAVTTDPIEKSNPKRIYQVLFAVLIFIVIVFITESRLDYSFLTMVSLLVIPFSLIWSLLLKKGNEFKKEFIDHFQTFAMSMKNQFFLFLSAGFFISTIQISGSNEVVNKWIIALISVIGSNGFLIILPFIPLAFAYLGFHPAVTLALMAETLSPEATNTSALILTVAMLAGATGSFLVGPFNATTGIMSSVIKQSSYKISSWNLPFTLIYTGICVIYILVLKNFI